MRATRLFIKALPYRPFRGRFSLEESPVSLGENRLPITVAPHPAYVYGVKS